MKKYNIISAFLMLLLFSEFAIAQNFVFSNEILGKPIEEKTKYFDTWARDQNPKKTKGWKHFQRWQWYNETRTNKDGSIALDSYYKEAVDKRSEFSKKHYELLSNNGWSPIGPLNFPPSYDNTSSHGIGRINCIEFHPTNPNIFWVGAPRGGIWKTNNGGLSWLPIGDNLPMARVGDIACHPQNPDELYIAVSDYAYVAMDVTNRVRYNGFGLGVYKTTDGGDTWFETGLSKNPKFKELSLIMGIIINPDAPEQLIAAGTTGVFVSDNAGETWEETKSCMAWDIKQDPLNPNTIYLTSGYLPNLINNSTATIFKSIDFGKTWTELNTDIPKQSEVHRIELAISPQDPNYIYAVCSGNDNGFHSFYKTTDGGINWTMQADYNSAPNIFGWMNGIKDDIGGQGNYDLTLIVNPKNKNEVFSGGVNCWGTDDGGINWKLITLWFPIMGLNIHADIHCTKYNPLNETYYFCTDGGVSKTKKLEFSDMEKVNQVFESHSGEEYNLPTVWTDISSGLAVTEFYRAAVSKNNPNYLIGGAQDNGTFYLKQNQWLNCIGGDGMDAMLDHNNPEIFYGTVYYGRLYRSDDGSKTFSNNSKSMTDTITKVDKGNWVTPFIMHPDNPEIIYAGFGNVWKSTDGAYTWERISDFEVNTQYNSPIPIFSMAVSSSNPSHIIAAKRKYPIYNANSQVLLTQNEGQTWADVSEGLPVDLYFNAVAFNNNNSNEIITAVSGFEEGKKVYRTTNAGQTWENISWNLPNVPVNTVIHQANSSIYYIGTDIGVFYCKAGENQWIPYSKYLPNTVVTDLEIQYPSNKLIAATFGRGVWEIALLNPLSDVQDKAEPQKLKVNFNDDELNIAFDNYQGEALLEIVNITGQSILQSDIQFSNGLAKINLSVLSGVYFIKITPENENKTYIEKIIKE